VCLLAAGNAPISDRPGVAMRQVADLSPCELVLAWKPEWRSPSLDAFIAACREVVDP
jgi:hypothetical protein